MSEEKYYNDYPKLPIGGSNPYYMCAHCHISEPEINGKINGHASYCKYRKDKERKIKDENH